MRALLAAAIAAMVMVAGPVQAESVKAQVVRAKGLGLTVMMPRDWQVYQSNRASMNLLTADGPAPRNQDPPRLTIQAVTIPGKRGPAAQMATYLTAMKAMPNFHKVGDGPASVGGLSAHRTVVTYGAKGEPARCEVLFAVSLDGRFYKISGEAPAKEQARYERMFNAMVKSIAFH